MWTQTLRQGHSRWAPPWQNGNGQDDASLEEAVRPARRTFTKLSVSPAHSDSLFLVAAMGAVTLSTGTSDPATTAWLLVYAVVSFGLLAFAGLYRPRLAPAFLDELRRTVAATAVAAMAVTFARVLLSGDPAAGAEALHAWVYATAFLAAGRLSLHLVHVRGFRRGGGDPTLIVGAGRIGRLVARRLHENPALGLRPVALLDDAPLDLDEPNTVRVIGNGARPETAFDPQHFSDHLEAAVREHDVRHVVLAFSLSGHETELQVVRRCAELGVTVSLVPRLFEGVTDQSSVERIGGVSLVTVRGRNPRGWQFTVKYAIDRVVASIALLLVSPVLVASAVAVLVSLGRPVFFRQHRLGRDGQEFEMLKFRTMRPAEPGGEADGELTRRLHAGVGPGGVEGADRRTRVGRLLRTTSLDELPQLFNVLRGEMSMIGPRPERPELARGFADRLHRYEDRSRVKSGITGWAQVHGLRGKTSLADRVEWDNYYIENWSLWLDVKTVLLTAPALIRQRAE